jgi:segregation and condensation protein A
MYQTKLEQFQGPLDLLLQLIEGQKLDISQVALAQVTDQYLSYLDKLQNISAEELADFLVIATKLLVIKSKLLLPQLADEEEDSAEELEAQLKLYRDYQEASQRLELMIGEENFSFSREKIAFTLQPTFSPPASVTAVLLQEIFSEVVRRVDYIVNLPQKVMEKVVSLTEMVSGIRQRLSTAQKFSFHQLLDGAKCRGDVVVCFMALLELIRAGEIAVNQKGVFDEIEVEKITL